MSKYTYHPNPRTGGDTGIYTREDGVDGGLVVLGVVIVVASATALASYLWGKANGRSETLKEALARYDVIDAPSDE